MANRCRDLRFYSNPITIVDLRRVQLKLEELETRTLLSASPLASLGSTLAKPQYAIFQDPIGYSPGQVRHAYGFDNISFLTKNGVADSAAYNAIAGKGTTIAIVTAYDDPNIENDLATFNKQFGLPPLDGLNGNPSFTKTDLSGGQTDPTGGWELETALDVEWAHAIGPAANIVLVEANSAQGIDLLRATDLARATPGVVAVSMSWGGNEFPSETSLDSHFASDPNHPVTLVAAAGDSGAGAMWPAASPYVLAVGGSKLTLNGQDQRINEMAWRDGGGGVSFYESQPGFQNGLVLGGNRSVPDVAYNADSSSYSSPGFAVFDSFPYLDNFYGYVQPQWVPVGGTSAGAPQWAGLVAIVDGARLQAGLPVLDGATQALPALYQLGGGNTSSNDFFDITRGGSLGFPGNPAGKGYDQATGLGSPKADRLVADLVRVKGSGSQVGFLTISSPARTGNSTTANTPPVSGSGPITIGTGSGAGANTGGGGSTTGGKVATTGGPSGGTTTSTPSPSMVNPQVIIAGPSLTNSIPLATLAGSGFTKTSSLSTPVFGPVFEAPTAPLFTQAMAAVVPNNPAAVRSLQFPEYPTLLDVPFQEEDGNFNDNYPHTTGKPLPLQPRDDNSKKNEPGDNLNPGQKIPEPAHQPKSKSSHVPQVLEKIKGHSDPAAELWRKACDAIFSSDRLLDAIKESAGQVPTITESPGRLSNSFVAIGGISLGLGYQLATPPENSEGRKQPQALD